MRVNSFNSFERRHKILNITNLFGKKEAVM